MWHLHAVGVTFKTHPNLYPHTDLSQRDPTLWDFQLYREWKSRCGRLSLQSWPKQVWLIDWIVGLVLPGNKTSYLTQPMVFFWTTHWPCGVTMLPQCFWDGLKDGTHKSILFCCLSCQPYLSTAWPYWSTLQQPCVFTCVFTGSWHPISFALCLWCQIAYQLTCTSETKKAKLTRLAERDEEHKFNLIPHLLFFICFWFP